MKLAPRLAVLLAAVAVTATACAPQTSDNSSSGKDEKSGTLRVWLFQEVDTKPKQKVVDAVLADFEKAHEGTEVDVEYIPVETRAQRIKAAFNDPDSAPDVIEYGNTDTAGYVKDGGLADVTEEFGAWDEAKDTDPTARQSVTVDGKVYGAPYFVGVRALYYRTDVFDELGLEAPRSLEELASTAKRVRAAKPDLYGIAVGGAYTYGAMPFLWAHGGELAT
ncbi:extracellular solute-binding protein, partial [Streptomyces sp. NPDC056652]